MREAIGSLVLGIGDPPRGMCRLWRIHPGIAAVAVPDWLAQALADNGHAEAEGRWFTDCVDLLPWYARDGWPGEPVLVAIVESETDVAAWRVDRVSDRIAGRLPVEFSADPTREYFVPRAVADRTLHVGSVVEAVARRASPSCR
jgi:hypothetical protein